VIRDNTAQEKVINIARLIERSTEKITKKFLERRKQMSTRIVRLVSGEEIICDYSCEDGTASFKNAAVLVPTGNGQLALMPWMMYAELEGNTISFSDEHVMFDVPPRKELMNEYNKTIGSGLVVPEATKPSLSLTT
tara:strand:+ start:431 stop:838 length:408 start_codon:yes stop_codon:yes gene_type:complete